MINFWGDPIPLRVCASKAWSVFSACKNFRVQHPLRAKMQSPEKSPLGCKFIKLNNFFVCGPKYTNFFSSNVGGVADLQKLFRFSISWSVPEIFAIKVESCQKSRRILDIFGGHKFMGVGLVKIVPTLSPLPHGTSTEKVPWRYCH